MGSGRNQLKRLLVSNMVSQKKPDVLFLQEILIHIDKNKEVDWGLWWTGWVGLSPGTNLSAGVAILFSLRLDMRVASTTEIVPGRVLVDQSSFFW